MKKLLSLAILLLPQSLFAEIITDRPDASEASQVVGQYNFQLEAGFLWTEDDEVGRVTSTGLPTLLRFGVTEKLELRLEGDMLSSVEPAGVNGTHGFSDISLGTKVYFGEIKATGTHSGFITRVVLPTGDDAFSDDSVIPEAVFIFDGDFNDTFGYATNLGGSLAGEDTFGERVLNFTYTATGGVSLDTLTPGLGLFAEIAGVRPLKDREAPIKANAGFTYLLSDNAQLDVLGTVALNSAAEDYGFGFGFSFLDN